MIRSVIFDLGWTLMRYDGDGREINRRAYLSVADFLKTNGIVVPDDFPTLFHKARERGWKLADETRTERTVEDALRETLAQLGYTSIDGIAPRAVEKFFEDPEMHWVAYDDAIAMLQDLGRRGCQMGLISNADDVGLVHRLVKRLGFAPYLSPVLSSAEEPRWRKPDPRIFHSVSDTWHVSPSEIVVVGDAPIYDILGAHRAGMHAILMDRGENYWWQQVPDTLADDPGVRADAVCRELAEIPAIIEAM